MNISISIQGVTPLLCNRFTDSAQISATAGHRTAMIGEQPSPHDQAEARLYVNEAHLPIIPQPNLFRCLIDAGKFFKSGKSKLTTQSTSLLPSCLAIAEIEIPIVHREPWSVDTRPVRIPSTGGRILCHRPCFQDWCLHFTCEVDGGLIVASLVRELVDSAGKRIGLGDFRPDRKGPFGRFVVTRWEASS